MKPNAKRIVAIAAGLAFGFGLLYISNATYRKITVGDPLDRAFKESPSVISHEVLKRQPVVVVRATLRDVADLRGEVRGLEERASAALKGQRVFVEVRDTRDPALTEAYYAMHFHIQEALVTGGFSDMVARVSDCARRAGLDRHRVFVDDDRVYVQLHQGGRYLYEILPRQGQAGSSSGGVR